jgi:ankyrin repeat protein
MNTTDLTPLPARPNLEQYKKQAKELVRLAHSGDPGVAERVRKHHVRPTATFALANAQLVIAREHGFESWPKFARQIKELGRENSPVSIFEMAADAVINGDLPALETLLREHPELARARSTRVHRATLLHFTGANGFENYRQKTPKNAVEIAKLLLNAGAEVDALADAYGKSTALALVATSIHPLRAGVQIALMEILLEHGADINNSTGGMPIIAASLRNGRRQAAEFLAGRGARLDFEAAAGAGRIDLVSDLFSNATKAQMEAGFLWACEYGRDDVVDFLLNTVDLATQGDTGQTGLHWAVVGGQLETIRMLLKRGAPLEARNVYGATALGQVLWSAFNREPGIDCVTIIETLIAAGAKIEDGTLDWLSRQEGSSSLKDRIAEVLLRHGAKS